MPGSPSTFSESSSSVCRQSVLRLAGRQASGVIVDSLELSHSSSSQSPEAGADRGARALGATRRRKKREIGTEPRAGRFTGTPASFGASLRRVASQASDRYSVAWPVSMLGDDAQSCTSERTGESRRAHCGRSDATPLPPSHLCSARHSSSNWKPVHDSSRSSWWRTSGWKETRRRRRAHLGCAGESGAWPAQTPPLRDLLGAAVSV